MSDDPYINPDTRILKNKLGIEDKETLNSIETRLSINRIDELKEKPIAGNFDQKHLQDIHHYIFQDIYDMAGEIRVIGIKKEGDPRYPHPEHPQRTENLQARLDYAFEQLKNDNLLVGIEKSKFSEKLSIHSSEIWGCHPFREGNTRTIAVFTRELVNNAGYKMSNNFPENPEAFRESLKKAVKTTNRDDLQSIFSASIEQRSIPEKKLSTASERNEKALRTKQVNDSRKEYRKASSKQKKYTKENE